MINKGDDLQEKKLRGSGGYVYAKVTEDEQRRANLGGAELFLAGVGRLDEIRFSKYYCNKCEREYEGSPMINYENPNEQLGEGVTLIEKGEYVCKTCNSILAQYRKFDTPGANSKSSMVENESVSKIQSPNNTGNGERPLEVIQDTSSVTKTTSLTNQLGFISIQSLIGMPAYDSEAILVGRIKEIGLRRSSQGYVQISIKISKSMDDGTSGISSNQTYEVMWNDISKIGDVVLLASAATKKRTTNDNSSSTKGKCASCGYQNEEDAIFCEECGNKLM